MKHTKLLRELISLLLCAVGFLFPSNNNTLVQDSIFTSKIERDVWGVPHIYGKTDADVSFGLAYAHCQDDFKTIENVVFALRGELASVLGREAAVNDYYVHLMNFWQMVEDRYETCLLYTSPSPRDV